MAKKASLFEKPIHSEAEVKAVREMMLRRYESGYVFCKDMKLKPGAGLLWHEQVLDLERQGKITSLVAHNMAIKARRRISENSVPSGQWDDE